MRKVGIITASDSGFAGKRNDLSGPLIAEIMAGAGYEVCATALVPDEREKIAAQIIQMADVLKVSLILTTGGTGFSQRDVTPEATKSVVERDVPGISEAIRAHSLSITKRAMLSRGVTGIRGECLVINLPGSPKAVRESLEFVLDQLPHALDILCGDAANCARSD